MRATRLLLIILLCLAVLPMCLGQFFCPFGCTCYLRSVRCLRGQLTKFPQIPPNTELLDLRFNQLKEIPAYTFQGLSRLKTLYLNENKIGTLHNNSFDGLVGLKYLNLNNNRLSRLPDGAFQKLKNLEGMFLDNNDIWQIDSNTFSNLKELSRLSLSNNKISKLPTDCFENLPKLKNLRLDGNPIDCNCGVYSLWRNQQTQPRGSQNTELTCETPKELYRRPFSSLVEANFHCKKPEIIDAPHDMTLTTGDTAVLPCRISGEPTPEITWMHNANVVSTNNAPKMKILSTGSLKIYSVDVNDNGIYECIGRNEMGEIKSPPASMTVEEQKKPPQFTREPTDQVVAIDGAPVILNCAATGWPQPEIQWYHNGRLITQSTQTTRIESNGSLIISQPTPHMAGTYKCEATNQWGSIQSSARIDVKELPEILLAPQDQIIKEGKIFILECDADGNPIPKISWQFNGRELEPNSRIVLENENTELIVNPARESDSGIYTCIATNENGMTKVEAKVEVEHNRRAPNIIIEPSNLEALVGTTIELPCKADDDDAMTITWRRDGRRIDPNQGLTEKYVISGTGSLLVKNATIFDGGRYECSLTNEFGRATASALVTIRNNMDLAPGDRYVRIAFAEAAKEIDIAINNTIDRLFTNSKQSNRSTSPPNYRDLMRVFRYPSDEGRQLARAAEIYERTLVNIRKHVLQGDNLTITSDNYEFKDLLSREHLHLVAELSGCMEHRETPNCTDMCFHSKYRSIEGTCNNLHRPTWGASLIAFRRIASPIYENGFSTPVGWTKNKLYAGFPKPNARLVSTTIFSTKDVSPDDKMTHMVMQWGQFIDHDMDHTVPSTSSESWDGVDCKKTCDFAPPCYPIEVPPNDPRVNNRRCIDLIRSSAICGSGMTSVFFENVQHREQINQLTSFIDGSSVYGSTYDFAQELRNLTTDDGLLRVGVQFPNQKEMMPFAAPQDGVDCLRNLEENKMNCFVAGDIRVNEQQGLLAMHILWMREHNRIAKKLRDINPHWDGDTIYQEARKIVGSTMQHITYKHWLPLILGDSGMKMMGEYRGYDPNVDPTIANEFTTAVLRFGHTLINPILHRLDASFKPIPQGNLPLHKAFFAPWRIAYEGGVDPLMRGLFTTPAKQRRSDQNLNSELTEKLFQSAHAVALDLAAVNIQRGRDHGIPGYNVYREFCNLSVAQNFDDLRSEISNISVLNKLKKLYGHPDNIDLWVGGVLEDVLPGAKVGPLLQCLLVEQFRRLRDGDRFYYENPSVFLPEQLQQIKEANLGRVICDNGDKIEEVTENVFLLPEKQGGLKKCEDIPGVNLYFWQDCGACNNLPPLFQSYVPQTYVKESSRRKRSIAQQEFVNASDSVQQTERNDNSLETLFEVNEDRVSGLEEMISSFQKELKKLHKKVHKLEESCSSNGIYQDESGRSQGFPMKQRRNHCVDVAGNTRLLNEVWSPDACTKCECRHSQVTCTHEKCPEVKCGENEEILTPPEACCAHCVYVGEKDRKVKNE